MSRPMIRIHDTATDEIIDREMNDQELAVYEGEQAAFAAQEAAITKAAAEKDALLKKLGITAEEAALLLG